MHILSRTNIEMSEINLSEAEDVVKKVTVVGGGSFGTSLATIAARCGHNVVMLVSEC